MQQELESLLGRYGPTVVFVAHAVSDAIPVDDVIVATDEAQFRRELDVVCLCAEWCSTCRDIHPAFQELEIEGCRFHWVDIEEHGDALEAVDVETFPTIIVAHRSGTVLFAGPIEPQIPRLERVVTVLRAGAVLPLDDERWRSVFASLKLAGVLAVA